jgi:predicted hydrolase (HD superfamily)
MRTTTPTREIAYALFKKYNNSESLLKHALSVEGVMRYMARKSEKMKINGE